MDPLATWQLLGEAYAAEDWVALFEHAASLHAWLVRGGHLPPWMAGRS